MSIGFNKYSSVTTMLLQLGQPSFSSKLAVWCSGNALVLINAVALHRARLVLG